MDYLKDYFNNLINVRKILIKEVLAFGKAS